MTNEPLEVSVGGVGRDLAPIEERCLGALGVVAWQRATMTYTHLAAILGLPGVGHYYSAQIGQILGEVSRHSHAEWGFLLSAVVVAKSDGLPGGRRDDPISGFWALADELGYDVSATRRLADEQQRKAYNHFGR